MLLISAPQKLSYLPERHADFIFKITIGKEAVFIVLGLLLVLAMSIWVVARRR